MQAGVHLETRSTLPPHGPAGAALIMFDGTDLKVSKDGGAFEVLGGGGGVEAGTFDMEDGTFALTNAAESTASLLSLTHSGESGAAIRVTTNGGPILEATSTVDFGQNLGLIKVTLNPDDDAFNGGDGIMYLTRSGTFAENITVSAALATLVHSPTTEGGTYTSSLSILSVVHLPSIGMGGGGFTDTTTGISVIMTPAAGPSAVNGISVVMGASCSGASALTLDWRGTAGVGIGDIGAGLGILLITVGAETTLTGRVTAIDVDLATNLTSNDNHITGLRIRGPVTEAFAASSTGLFVLDSDATQAYTMLVTDSGTSGVGFLYQMDGLDVNNSRVGWRMYRNRAQAVPDGVTVNGTMLHINNSPKVQGSTPIFGGKLLHVDHAPMKMFGDCTDTTTGLEVTMSPTTADSVTTGIKVTVGSNMIGPALDLVSPASGTNVAFAQFKANSTNDVAAGDVDTARLYARLNGGGKTELVCIFTSGVVQVVATEP